MVDVLADKRTATRFRILVEIAERQPAVSQGEIAEAVGVTSQAVSEYIRELVEDGYVEKEGRSRYRITKEGVDWLFGAADDARRYVEHVTQDVLGSVREDAAVAADPIAEGEQVTLSMREGLLRATPGDEGPATGVATTGAERGEVVGVTGFEGVIDYEPGEVSVLQVPAVGADDSPDSERLREACEAAAVVTATGVESVVALEQAGIETETVFSPGEVAADAARRGLDAVVVTAPNGVGRVTDALRDASVDYEVASLR
jgi:putative transcriptional regulator